MSAIEDKIHALSGNQTCNWRAEEIVKSLEFRKEYATRPNVITAEEMPWENSPDGKIKHLIHRNMNTPELCVEAYMLFLDAAGARASTGTCGRSSPSWWKAKATTCTGT